MIINSRFIVYDANVVKKSVIDKFFGLFWTKNPILDTLPHDLEL